MYATKAKKQVLKDCHIYQMLRRTAGRKHLSYHTPGHKIGRWDITELSYSDNLSAPSGCIAQAEEDIAKILGAKKSFLLTDGSTSGVLSMLYAAKLVGANKVAFLENSHKSVYNGCALLGLSPLTYAGGEGEIPFPPTMDEMKEKFPEILEGADALFLTSPNYYGKMCDLSAWRAYCDKTGKLLLIDGAHGGHLHFQKEYYAGAYADMWVDGVHKSLPALTQGAIVSARTEKTANALYEGVQIFRTTSPSYPIMASVEYAAKYPRNLPLENAVREYAEKEERIFVGEDYTKVCALFGRYAYLAEKELEKQGLYAEFCDGSVLMFYLSPASKPREIKALKKALKRLFAIYPFEEETVIQRNHTPLIFDSNRKTKWVPLKGAQGKLCAKNCGLFPPCTPLLFAGERIGKEQIEKLQSANNVYGLLDKNILIFEEEER